MFKSKLKRSTSIITLILLMFMITSIVVIPIIVNGQEGQNDRYIGLNDDDDDDGVDDDDEDKNKRNVEVELSGPQATIKSDREINDATNSFELQIKGDSDKLYMQFNYETNGYANVSDTDLEYDIEMEQLIGYNDTNANDIYDPGIDDVSEVYNIGLFKDTVYEFQNTTQGELHIIELETLDGIFGVVVYVSNEFVDVGDSVISPTEVKFDILINGFTGSFDRVALKTELEFDGEVEYDEETEDEEYDLADDEAEYELSFEGFKGFFSWSQVAKTDGVEYPVYHTPFDPLSVDDYIYFSYVAGNEIVHDPKIGVANLLTGPIGIIIGLLFPEMSRTGYLILTATAALATIVIATVAITRKRR